ncbi:MAG: hypothetical protein ABIG61_13650 [Planctomycetota bacterium]
MFNVKLTREFESLIQDTLLLKVIIIITALLIAAVLMEPRCAY